MRTVENTHSVSVSISPSGGIVEGSSVTLTCSSDGDPPVENYTWFKGSSSVGTGGTYSIPNISSEDSGEYTCQSRNELGERRSTAVSLNVLCTLMMFYYIPFGPFPETLNSQKSCFVFCRSSKERLSFSLQFPVVLRLSNS
uniref:Ig-like domain-containing protein n=1 Tax=Astyanax mexicanus TaxID=7994 RepID=A0A3B1JGL5_ASTMX